MNKNKKKKRRPLSPEAMALHEARQAKKLEEKQAEYEKKFPHLTALGLTCTSDVWTSLEAVAGATQGLRR